MMLKRVRGWVGFVALAALGACGGKSGVSSGSNSNWVCTTDADCVGNGQSLSCVEGYCHEAIQTSTGGSANGTSAGATSAGGGATSASGGATSAGGGATSAGGGATSAGGVSTSSDTISISTGGGQGPATGAGGSVDGASCDTQTATISSAINGALGSADTACTTDADCAATTFDMGPSCSSTCGGTAVSIAGLASIENAFDYIDRYMCPGFKESGCTALGPVPCLAPSLVTCQAGHCARSSEPGASKLTCDQYGTLISDRINLIESAADIDCTFDSDCTTIPRANSCFSRCSTRPLSKTGAAEVQTTLDEIDKDICSQMTDAPCRFPVVPCAVAPATACVMGQCTVKLP